MDNLIKYNIKLKYDKDVNNIENLTKLQSRLLLPRVKSNNYKEYIEPKLDIMENLYKLKDIDKAGELLAKCITEKKRICLAFDYDCDGLNSGAVLTMGLIKLFGLKKDKDFIAVPNRRKDGNGFNPTLCKRIFEEDKKNKIDIVITSDHGSSDNFVIPQFTAKKMQFLLTDHHLIPKDNYPDAATVFINNQRKDSAYDNGVSGCFVAFLLIVATYDKLHGVKDQNVFNFLLPYVALTTISDVMPLDRPINRAMLHYGMYEMNSGRNILWATLKNKLGINTAVDSLEIGFKLAPLINTASRTGIEDVAYSLLVSEDPKEINILTTELLKMSKFRKIEQKRLSRLAMEQIDLKNYPNTITIALDSHYAVGGVISAQIGESFNRPTVCFIKDTKGNYTGSMRAVISNVHLGEVLSNINQEDGSIFIKFGGHKEAAGCTIYSEKLDIFKKLFDKYVSKYPMPDDNYLYIDDFLEDVDINVSTIKELSRLEPYGKQWEPPIFTSYLKVKYYNIYSNMCRFVFKTSKGRELEAIYFLNKNSTYNATELDNNVKNGNNVVVTYKMSINNFSNKTNIQLNIIDIVKKEH